MSKAAPKAAYHHGDLRNALLVAAKLIIEKDGVSALSLRALAREAKVSHAAPYRHFASCQALLAEIAVESFAELRNEIAQAWANKTSNTERVAAIGGAHMRFVARKPAIARLMFGNEAINRTECPALTDAAKSIGLEIEEALGNAPLGIAVWSAIHGLAVLVLEDSVDLGQHRAGPEILPSRAEIILRGLTVNWTN